MPLPDFMKRRVRPAYAAMPAPAPPLRPQRFDPFFRHLGHVVIAFGTVMSWRGWYLLGMLCGYAKIEAGCLSILTDGFAGAVSRVAFAMPYCRTRTRVIAGIAAGFAIVMSMGANAISIVLPAHLRAVHSGMHGTHHVQPAPLWVSLPCSMVAPLSIGITAIVAALAYRDYKIYVRDFERQAEAMRQAEEAEAARQAEAELARQAEAAAARTAEAEAVRAQAEAEAERLGARAAADQAAAEAAAAEVRRLAAEARQQGVRDRKPAPPRSPAPASRRLPAASPQATEESIDRLMTAMDALRGARREGRDLNGAQIGVLVGISSRGGRDLRKRALLQLETEAEAEAAFAGIAGGSGTADGSGSGSGSGAR